MDSMKTNDEACDGCRYRSREAPFCGYCLKKILIERREATKSANGQAKAKDSDQTGR